MKMIPVNSASVKSLVYKHTPGKAMRIVTEFMESGHEIVKLEYAEGEYANASSACSTVYKAAKRLRCNVSVIVRSGTVYLMRR